MEKENKLSKKFLELVDIIKELRGSDGCPWDREQTPKDVKTYLLEEVYELVEGIEEEAPKVIQEELGDVLLLIIFLSDYYEKKENFCLSEVIKGISNKLIRRHPHVFSDLELDTAEEVIKNWNKLKEEEKYNKEREEFLDGIPKSAPALLRTYLFIKKARRFHKLELNSSEEIVQKMKKELNSEFPTEKKKAEDKIVNLLFNIISLSANLEINPESLLLKYLENYSSQLLTDGK